MRLCPYCDSENPDSAVFCENCGRNMNAEIVCPNCQHSNKAGSVFCANCGFDLKTTFPWVLKDTNKNVEKDNVDKSTENESQYSNNKNRSSSNLREPDQSDHKKKWSRLFGALIILVLIGAGIGYMTISSNSKQHHPTKIVNKNKQSNKVSSDGNTDTKNSKVSFASERIKQDITETIGSIKGTNSAYVTPVNSKKVVSYDVQKQKSASLIKLFIMVTAYDQSDKGEMNLNEKHTLTDDEKVEGTGTTRNMSEGTEISYRDLLKYMIEDSDNTAANIMIDAVGGMDVVNKTAKEFGATDTELQRKMLDTDALKAGKDNVTSAKDIGELLKSIYNHKILTASSDDEMLDYLRNQHTRDKLPASLPDSTTVYNKTGEFGDYGVQNDGAIIENDKGAFVVCVLSEDGSEQEQKNAMSELGLQLYNDILL